MSSTRKKIRCIQNHNCFKYMDGFECNGAQRRSKYITVYSVYVYGLQNYILDNKKLFIVKSILLFSSI